jgi:hypothetical protein
MEGPDTEKAERGGPSGFCALSGFPGSAATFPTDGFTGRSAAPPGRAGRGPAMPTHGGSYHGAAAPGGGVGPGRAGGGGAGAAPAVHVRGPAVGAANLGWHGRPAAGTTGRGS